MMVSITDRLRWIALVSLSLSWVLVVGVAQGQTTPEREETTLQQVSGRVVQGTAGAPLPPDLVITLHIFDAIFSEETLQTGVDASGNFVFEAVPIDEDNTYFVSTEYLNQSYASVPFTGDPGTSVGNLVIEIYEPTTDPARIEIIGLSTQIDLAANQEGMLRVAQLIRFANTSDRLYVGTRQLEDGRSAVLDITLPVGAIVVELESEDRFVLEEDRFRLIDTRPLPPGNEHVIYAVYLMPYRDAAIIEYPVGYALDGPVRVLVAMGLSALHSDQLAALGTEMIDGSRYLAYGRTLNLSPGNLIQYELTGSIVVPPQSDESNSSSSNGLTTFVAGAITLLVGAAIGLAIFRRGSGAADNLKTASEDLLRQIADLDSQQNAGQINHDLYQRRRAELQNQLEGLTEQEPTESRP